MARPLPVNAKQASLLNALSTTRLFLTKKSSLLVRATQSMLQAYAMASTVRGLSANAVNTSSYSSSLDLCMSASSGCTGKFFQ